MPYIRNLENRQVFVCMIQQQWERSKRKYDWSHGA